MSVSSHTHVVAEWPKPLGDQSTRLTMVTSPSRDRAVHLRDHNATDDRDGRGIILGNTPVVYEMVIAAYAGTDEPVNLPPSLVGTHLATIERSAIREIRVTVIKVANNIVLEFRAHDRITGDPGRAMWTTSTDRTLRMVDAARIDAGLAPVSSLLAMFDNSNRKAS